MTIVKAVISTWLDSLEPRDAIQITPHFEWTGVIQDADDLADGILAAWGGYITGTNQTAQRRVTLYDAQGTKPVYPMTVREVNTGVAPASALNRDVALCLSYYAGDNRPRKRGRLYVPMCLVGQTPSAARAPTTSMTKVADLVPVLAGIGGVDVNWVVWSKADNAARKVTNWWVDNSWDTQRRRGSRATARQQGTTGG